jgi:hypothetical protein
MKKKIAAITVLLLIGAFCAASGADQALPYNRYVCYFAGVELLSTATALGRQARAERYRQLCEVTGVTGTAAKAFALKYRYDPAGWQKFQSKVLETLQKKE